MHHVLQASAVVQPDLLPARARAHAVHRLHHVGRRRQHLLLLGPRNVVRAPPDRPSAGSRPAPAPQTHRGHYLAHLGACHRPSDGLRYVARRAQPVVRDVTPAKPAAARSGLAHTTLQRRGKCTRFPKVPPWCNRTFFRSARAPSRFIGCTTWASLGTPSLERPVIGHEAPHAPLSSRIYILPRRSRRARALD